jgi:nicotinamidase-related amidase
MISPAQQHGFGNRSGFGLQAALLVVDFARGFTSPASRLGADMAGEIVQANRLILATRTAGAPVYLSTIA